MLKYPSGQGNGVCPINSQKYAPDRNIPNYGRYQAEFGFNGAVYSGTELKSNGTVGLVDGSVDLSNTSYTSKSFNAGSQDTAPQDVKLSTDGTKMYTVGTTNRTIYQYTLSTAYDLSTASYASKSFSVNSQDTFPTSSFFSTDGTKMYVMGGTNRTVYQYTLSTAWDVSTASYASKSFSVNSQDTFPTSLFLTPDGTKMYVAGNTNRTIYQYTLSTPWDVSTASYASKSYTFGSNPSNNLYGVSFASTGLTMIVSSYSTPSFLYQYTLSTAWDVTTASYASKSFNTSSQSNNAFGFALSSNNSVLFLIAGNTDTVYQYNIANPASTTSGTITKTYTPSDLQKWGNAKWTETKPANTSMTCEVLDNSNNVLKSNVISITDLSDINISTYPTIKIKWTLTRNSVSDQTPVLSSSSVTWEGSRELTSSVTYDPISLTTGSQTSTTVTVNGAVLGDIVDFSFSLDLQLIQATAYVSSANVVTVVLRNGIAGTIDLASGTLTVKVRRY